METPNFVAGGSIYPASIVVLDLTADSSPAVGSFTALQASPTTDKTAVNLSGAGGSNNARSFIGIAMPGSDYPPINDSTHVSIGDSYGNPYAAVIGEDLQIAGIGQYAMLRLGAAVLCGELVTVCTATAATGVASASAPLPGWGAPIGSYNSAAPQQYVGKALQSGAAGETILVLVNPGIF